MNKVISLLVLGAVALFPGTGAAQGGPEREVRLFYTFTVEEPPSSAGEVRAWIPLPLSTEHQEVRGYKVLSGQSCRVVTEEEYGNRYLYFALDPSADDLTVRVVFQVGRRAYRALEGAPMRAPPAGLERFLRPDHLVPIDGPIAAEAERVAGDTPGILPRARRLYDHVVQSVAYDKSGKGWGHGDALYVCDARTGNCTDFHSLFIGEARALRIPARFIMGIPLPADRAEGDIPGYHCWAEFYLPDRGWIPIDASEARKDPGKLETFFGGLDANRIQFTVGRDILIPLARSGRVNYSIYPHVEVDGEVYPRVRTHFAFRDVAPAPAAYTERRSSRPAVDIR